MRHFRFGSRERNTQRAGEVPVACVARGPPRIGFVVVWLVVCVGGVLFWCCGRVGGGVGVSRETLLVMVSCVYVLVCFT